MPIALSAFLAISLDGHIARADGGLDWLEPFQGPGHDYGYDAFIGGVDAVVMGRTTYDTVLNFGVWPFGEREVVVLTHRALEPRFGERAYAGALTPLLADLAQAGRTHVYLDGGQAVRQGLREGVLTALTLTIIPTILGAGRPLFDATVPASHWRPMASTMYPTGPVQLQYERAENGW